MRRLKRPPTLCLQQLGSSRNGRSFMKKNILLLGCSVLLVKVLDEEAEEPKWQSPEHVPK